MAGIFRRLSNHKTKILSDNELRENYIEFYNKKIAELEKEYKELIQKPYQASRLSEIVSELGRMWNERLRYEDVEGKINGDGAKNLQQVRKEVSNILQGVKEQLPMSQELDDKMAVLMKGLEKLSIVLDKWETGLE